MILFMTYLMPDGSKTVLEGNTVAISAMRYGGSSFIVIKKTADKKKAADTGIVDVTVYPKYPKNAPDGASPGQASAPLSGQKQFVWTDMAEEEFRFAVPFESASLYVHVQAGADTAGFTVNAE